jgi:CheY-like chemotaxis protein
MPRIVLAEDNAVIAVLLGEVIGSLGHEVCAIVATVDGLVSAAARHHPDLLIVDEHLAEGSGVLALSRILSGGHVAHLIMSGGPVEDMPAGAVLLEKPFSNKELAAAIARALAA